MIGCTSSLNFYSQTLFLPVKAMKAIIPNTSLAFTVAENGSHFTQWSNT